MAHVVAQRGGGREAAMGGAHNPAMFDSDPTNVDVAPAMTPSRWRAQGSIAPSNNPTVTPK
jgi:hypothetical protein